MISFLLYFLFLWYLEIVFHICNFGMNPFIPMLSLSSSLVVAALETMTLSLFPKKGKKIFFWIPFAIEWILFCVQTVYFHIFKQPLQWKAMFVGGQDALTNYYREALLGVCECIPIILLMMVPLIIYAVLLHKKVFELPQFGGIFLLRIMVFATLGLVVRFDTMTIGRVGGYEYYEDYTEFFDPITVMERMGVGVMIERDATMECQLLLSQKGVQLEEASDFSDDTPGLGLGALTVSSEQEAVKPAFAEIDASEEQATPKPSPACQTENSKQDENTEPTQQKESIDDSPNVIAIDFEQLAQLSGKSKEKNWLCQYLQTVEPTKKNEYTGMFEGYNLIFLTAEGFCTYAISEELTPTLYKLTHSGIVCNNYYVPLWQTSTSDGEYINSTGLIPDGQFSMRKSGDNNMCYSLPSYFKPLGADCYAFHNNSLTYYDRHITHPNLGYTYMAAKKGDMSGSQAEGKIFPMENPGYWPASDYEMMIGTMPYYENQDRFLVYYMTVSGHMNYNFTGNRMSAKNKDAVAGLAMSENARAYIACQIELDKALEYMLQELERVGQLDRTVICLSADHYPYAMTSEQYEELAGKDLTQDLDVYRNSLILWNSQMEEPIVVDKACGSMDLIPTLLNLFGIEYDSRMYAGRDIFGPQEGLVIFNDRSFVTDTVAYNKKKKTTNWYQEPATGQEAYLAAAKEEVKNRYQFSAYILRNNYYDVIAQCR